MYTIREACALLGVKPHVLRYWEHVIPMVAPRKDSYGRRTYSRADINRLARVRYLIRERGLNTAAAARQLWRDAADANADLRAAIAEIRGELLDVKALLRRRREEAEDEAGTRERLQALERQPAGADKHTDGDFGPSD